MSEHIKIACPSCGKEAKVKAEFAGREVECTCGETFTASAKKQKQYFVKRGAKVRGPFTGAQVKELAKTQKVRAEDEIGPSKSGPWTNAGTALGIAASQEQPPGLGESANDSQEEAWAPQEEAWAPQKESWAPQEEASDDTEGAQSPIGGGLRANATETETATTRCDPSVVRTVAFILTALTISFACFVPLASHKAGVPVIFAKSALEEVIQNGDAEAAEAASGIHYDLTIAHSKFTNSLWLATALLLCAAVIEWTHFFSLRRKCTSCGCTVPDSAKKCHKCHDELTPQLPIQRLSPLTAVKLHSKVCVSAGIFFVLLSTAFYPSFTATTSDAVATSNSDVHTHEETILSLKEQLNTLTERNAALTTLNEELTQAYDVLKEANANLESDNEVLRYANSDPTDDNDPTDEKTAAYDMLAEVALGKTKSAVIGVLGPPDEHITSDIGMPGLYYKRANGIAHVGIFFQIGRPHHATMLKSSSMNYSFLKPPGDPILKVPGSNAE